MRTLALLVLLGGCSLYWPGGHGDDVVCNAAEAIPAEDLRNPATGQCEAFSGGGGCGPCAPCAGEVAFPNWPICAGTCEGLAESACLSTPSCHAAYTDNFDANIPPQFWQCWDTETAFGTKPVVNPSLACNTLTADDCIFRDNCAGIYTTTTTTSQFERCTDEPAATSCDGVTCTTGSHCELQCNALNGPCQAFCVPDALCQGVDCGPGATCVETCNNSGGCGTCTATCVATTQCAALATEVACKARTDCEPIYKGDNCTCTPTDCTCQTETYERCQAR